MVERLYIHGNVRRIVEETELVNFVPFAKIPPNKTIGDTNVIYKLLNDWTDIEHNECKEYDEEYSEFKY